MGIEMYESPLFGNNAQGDLMQPANAGSSTAGWMAGYEDIDGVLLHPPDRLLLLFECDALW